MLRYSRWIIVLIGLLTIPCAGDDRPNILLAISDDQSWPHASAYGSKMVSTPHFDRIAREGALFSNAFAASPGCSPSRAALLTGRNTWQIEHAGTHASYFDPKYATYPDKLAESGYFTGSTGKGWAPGNFTKLGRPHNPAGPGFPASSGKSAPGNYHSAFANFLEQRPEDKPFCFWFGSQDPHRAFEKGAGIKAGKTLQEAEVPAFLPDTPEVRSDLLDYAMEIERFDADLGKILALLEKSGELDNTLVIVTSDNGMAFPRAKANCFEFGIHVPLAMRWPRGIPESGRTLNDLVGFTDITATLYDATGTAPPDSFPLVGTSLLPLLKSDGSELTRAWQTAVFSARERHSSSRFHSLGYPQRCIRTKDYLYIRNFAPERWPAGPARKFATAKFRPDGSIASSKPGPDHGAYHDIDACPTLTFLIEQRSDAAIDRYLKLATERRPAEELYAIGSDPACLKNLADDPAFANVSEQLGDRLNSYLSQTADPRVTGNGDVWESYPRVSGLRWFPVPDWAQESPERVPEMPWLESRRPLSLSPAPAVDSVTPSEK
ncbi:MAG: N-sulfoglucosamine sulfohydrolase [Verrucomicrobiales bacterium]|jgi:N-sulfoglucosamine sulfohydrolase